MKSDWGVVRKVCKTTSMRWNEGQRKSRCNQYSHHYNYIACSSTIDLRGTNEEARFCLQLYTKTASFLLLHPSRSSKFWSTVVKTLVEDIAPGSIDNDNAGSTKVFHPRFHLRLAILKSFMNFFESFDEILQLPRRPLSRLENCLVVKQPPKLLRCLTKRWIERPHLGKIPGLVHKIETSDHLIHGSHFFDYIEYGGTPSAYANFSSVIEAFEDHLNDAYLRGDGSEVIAMSTAPYLQRC